MVKKAINEHAEYNTEELDKSSPVKKEPRQQGDLLNR